MPKISYFHPGLLGIDYVIIMGGRFRLSRLKEVDTVFDAFFLVQPRSYLCPHCGQRTNI